MIKVIIMLSSIDITYSKRKKLWLFIIIGIVAIAIIISWFRPEHKKLKRQVDHSLIEVKYDDDSMQKWTMASELQLKNLLSQQVSYKKILEKQTLLIDSMREKENEQNNKLSRLE